MTNLDYSGKIDFEKMMELLTERVQPIMDSYGSFGYGVSSPFEGRVQLHHSNIPDEAVSPVFEALGESVNLAKT
jgi:hypothetical protein